MQFRERAKRLLSRKAIVGWVAVIKAVWDKIGDIGTAEFVVKYMIPIWNFLSTSLGTIVLVVVGFGLILWAVLRPTSIKNPQKQTPAKYTETTEKTINSLHQEIDTLNSEVAPYREILASQKGKEEKWLRPVIEWIDLKKRDWLSANQVMINYQIDSGLVYDFKPYRMWVKLRIGQIEPKDGWEVLQTPNLLKGKRSQFASETFTIIDDKLLKMVEECRQGLKIAQTIKIIVQLRNGEELRVLESLYSVNPYPENVENLESQK